MFMRRAFILPLALLLMAASSLAATAPVITSLNPSTAIVGTGIVTLQVTGSNFVAGAIVRVNNASRSTTFTDSQHLTAQLFATDAIQPATLQVLVANPGNVLSNTVTFTVLPNQPTIASIDPSKVGIGSGAFTLTVTGQNFAATAVVRVNGNARPTTYVSATTLTAAIPATDDAAARTLNITVLNPNNVLSNTVTLSVSGTAAPVITLLSPSTVNSGGTAFTLQILGSNFTSTASVRVNGNLRSSTFVDSGTLRAQILASDIATPGSVSVTVTTAGGTSAPATLTVVSPNTPSITSISPSVVTSGGATFKLTVTGTNFQSGAVIKVNGAIHTTTFVSSTSLTTNVFSSDIATAGQLPITVTNPGTGPTTSNAVTLFVVTANGPRVDSISPSTVDAGSSDFPIVLNGANFLSDDVLVIGSSFRPVTFVSTTQVTATILAADVASPGTINLAVARHDGSLQSPPVALTVTSAAAPTITTLAPATAATGDAPFTLTINGTNFESGAVVTFDGSPRGAQFVSSTSLTVPVTTADLATEHTISIVVTNPGGLASAPATFAVSTPVPTIASLTPNSVISGDSGFLLKVAGTHFSSHSVINVNGNPRSTDVETSTGNLTTNIDASEIATPGTLTITVTDSGATSAPATLAIVKPVIVDVTPSALPFGATSATITVTGTAFLPTSKVLFHGIEQPTTFNSDGTLTATLGPDDLLAVGLNAVVVRNSPTSTSVPFLITVVGVGQPAISSLSPGTIAAGSGDTTVDVFGSNFVPLSVVNVDGAQRTTTFVSSTDLQFTLDASELLTPHTLTVTVVNPDASRSAGATLTISGPPPPRRRAAPH